MTLNDNILEHMGEAASKASAVSGGQSREEFFAGRRAGRRAGSPRWYRAKAKDAHAIHFGDGLSVGAREKPRSGLLPAASPPWDSRGVQRRGVMIEYACS